MSIRTLRGSVLILLCFFFSGATGLIYEVLWTKSFALVMGSALLSITTVVTTFMGGLALGSLFGGRLIDRKWRPLRTYALLEALVGVSALLVPLVLSSAQPLFGWLYQGWGRSPVVLGLVQFLISALVLMVPTTLMGATLPILTKYFVDGRSHLGSKVSVVYAINTLGATAGACLAGFVLLPLLGHANTNFLAVAMNLGIAGLIVFAFRRESAAAAVPGKPTAKARKPKRAQAEAASTSPEGAQPGRLQVIAVMVAVGLAGLAGMIYQLGWTRLFILNFGCSTYAFSLVLTAFILGLGLGSLVCSRWIDGRFSGVGALAGVQIVVGIYSLMIIPVLGYLPVFTIELISRYAGSFGLLKGLEFLVAAVLMLVPTLLMGMAFPLASRIVANNVADIGKTVGNVYAANTTGAILGSFSAGFILLPWLGLQHSLYAAAGVSVLAGCLLIALGLKRRRLLRGGLVASAIACVAGFFMFLPSWNRLLLSSGPFIYAARYKKAKSAGKLDLVASMSKAHEVLFYEDGGMTTVAVKRHTLSKSLTLYVNGKPDASSSGDMGTQVLLAQIPMLMAQRRDRVLVIGLGSGVTAGSALLHPVSRLDCVEISPAIMRAAWLFAPYNHGVLDDDRLNVIIGDGRNHVMLTDKQYDVIISEPSNPWISGVSNLFTREFYEGCLRRLSRDGIMCQWMHGYSMDPEDFRMVVETFRKVFPHVTLWESSIGGDYVLLGTRKPLVLDMEKLEGRCSQKAIQADLKRVDIRGGLDLMERFVAGNQALSRYASGARVNSDDYNILEYSAPRNLHRPLGRGSVLEHLKPLRESAAVLLVAGAGGSEEVRDALDTVFRARQHLLAGYAAMPEGGIPLDYQVPPKALVEYEAAWKLRPEAPEVVSVLAEDYFKRGSKLFQKGALDASLEAFERVASLKPDHQAALNNIGGIYMRKREHKKARSLYERLTKKWPTNAIAFQNLGMVCEELGDNRAALAHFEAALRLKAMTRSLLKVKVVKHSYMLGRERQGKGDYASAATLYKRCLELEPRHEWANLNLGGLLFQQKRYADAAIAFEGFLKMFPDHADGTYNLGLVYLQMNRAEKARAVWARFCKKHPNNPRAAQVRKTLAGMKK